MFTDSKGRIQMKPETEALPAVSIKGGVLSKSPYAPTAPAQPKQLRKSASEPPPSKRALPEAKAAAVTLAISRSLLLLDPITECL